nr:hypothetical protein [Tanacetum cinerariifolium]
MKAIIRKDKCLAAIVERPAEVTDDSKWDEMDENAITNLHLALADGVLSSIEEKKSAKEIWDHLDRLYEAKSFHNKKFLKRKLYALCMTESTSVTEHGRQANQFKIGGGFGGDEREVNGIWLKWESQSWEISLALQKMVMICVVKQQLQMKAGRDLQMYGCSIRELLSI